MLRRDLLGNERCSTTPRGIPQHVQGLACLLDGRLLERYRTQRHVEGADLQRARVQRRSRTTPRPACCRGAGRSSCRPSCVLMNRPALDGGGWPGNATRAMCDDLKRGRFQLELEDWDPGVDRLPPDDPPYRQRREPDTGHRRLRLRGRRTTTRRSLPRRPSQLPGVPCVAGHRGPSGGDGRANVVTKTDYSAAGSGTAACLGCHDTRDAAAHAYLNTAVFGEACGACHGATSEWSVATVHAG